MVVSKGLPYENVTPFYLTCRFSYLPACGQNRGVQRCLEELGSVSSYPVTVVLYLCSKLPDEGPRLAVISGYQVVAVP